MRQTTFVLLLFVSCGTAAPAPHRMEPPADDVSRIAEWLLGGDGGGAFNDKFGDPKFLKDAKDAIVYTDVSGARFPKGLRPVPYEYVKARMDRVREGHKLSPAVLITRTEGKDSADDPDRELRLLVAKDPESKARYYYIEVAIGNLAWHWIKLVIIEKDGKARAEIIKQSVS